MRFHITRSDADRNADSTDNGGEVPDLSGATINGGVFGGTNHGIRGGVFHGRIIVEDDDNK
ncbi:hypothetical protein [Streptomyces drozdowiczii]|uniref:Uncharacterized protein n=1 Tax=Streptomyces drozdowiczii TaxID=202862 RepID=A0ABY6Q1C5_9ACTN|nr:hypothetical protein [Streptomyces drozdowiczii]MCX0247950.1 hypothetical protein [Streptomyces drozdowiczii]UZK58211.1 hypothetical protein NEH16_32745 [Streptomyces drozdowiczii]